MKSSSSLERLARIVASNPKPAVAVAPASVYGPLYEAARKADTDNRAMDAVLDIVGADLGMSESDLDRPYRSPPVDFIKANKERFSQIRSYAKLIPWIVQGFARILKEDPRAYDQTIEWLTKYLNSIEKYLKGRDFLQTPLSAVIQTQKNIASELAKKQEKIVYKFADGHTFRRLTKLQQIRDEGNAQGHCCGDLKRNYDHYAEENGWDPANHKAGVYSLRDPENKRLITVILRDDGTIYEAVSKQNSSPSPENLKRLREAVPEYDISQFAAKQFYDPANEGKPSKPFVPTKKTAKSSTNRQGVRR